jgi:hypothetical protein
MQGIRLTNHPLWAAAILIPLGAPKMMEVFSNPLTATDWNMYQATRTQLNLSILDFLARSQESNGIFNMEHGDICSCGLCLLHSLATRMTTSWIKGLRNNGLAPCYNSYETI